MIWGRNPNLEAVVSASRRLADSNKNTDAEKKEIAANQEREQKYFVITYATMAFIGGLVIAITWSHSLGYALMLPLPFALFVCHRASVKLEKARKRQLKEYEMLTGDDRHWGRNAGKDKNA